MADEWPPQTPVGAVRFARRTGDLHGCREFYGTVIGLPLLFTFEDDGCGSGRGLIFGVPDTALTFEVIQTEDPPVVDPHDQFVLYLSGSAARDRVAERLLEAGAIRVDHDDYWSRRGGLTFLDPDGRQLILAPWVFGQEPVPRVIDPGQT